MKIRQPRTRAVWSYNCKLCGALGLSALNVVQWTSKHLARSHMTVKPGQMLYEQDKKTGVGLLKISVNNQLRTVVSVYQASIGSLN